MQGDHDIIYDHTQLLGKLSSDIASAHKRINNLDDFIVEMRKMNTNVTEIAYEIKVISKTLVKHEEAIEDVKSRMETKEGMQSLHTTITSLDERLTTEENKEAIRALAAINKIKWWFVGSIGAVMFTLLMMYLGLR